MEYNIWSTRIKNANKLFGEWHTRFRCDILEEYYEGFQWKGKKDFLTVNYNPYTINLFYSTIKIKLSSLLFQKPSFLLSPRPGNSDWDLDFAVRSATLKQDTLNTIIQNPNCYFKENCKLAALDSILRFAIMEVGYAADWRNPQKEPPLLSNHDEPTNETPIEKVRVIDDNELPYNERFYFKRINPRRFRVSVSDATFLRDHEWVGYYEYYYTDVLKKTKGIKFPKEYDSQLLSADYSSGIVTDLNTKTINPDFIRLLAQGSVTKVWHVWDLVSHERKLLMDGNYEELFSDGFERLPFVDLRWDTRLEGWYPMPPAFQWISAQDEINEAREQTRSFRRRFTRKFQVLKDQIDEEEKEKFVSGPDGVLITVKQLDAITPIQNPEQGQTADKALVVAKEDFNIISGTSAEARGQSADRETATAAKIIDARSQIRESAEQLDFSEFLCLVGRETLAQAAEKLVDGIWVKYNTNPSEDLMTQMQANRPYFSYIKAQDLADGYDFDVEYDIQNATPAAMEQSKQSFITFVSLLRNFPELASSPVLIREAAYRSGYRNEKVIQQMQQAALAAIAAKQALAAQPQGQPGNGANGGGNNVAATQVAQQASPTAETIDQQIQGQLLQ